MAFILGIDTGGTYTDGVMVDADTREITCKAKALTTKQDLTLGIRTCMEKLDILNPKEISLVSLSTTLATNAIVENRGAKVGLIYLGAELEAPVPASQVVKVKGKFDVMGHLIEDLDQQEVENVLESMKGLVEAIAISGYASVRNPEHEQEVKRMAKTILDVPVICAHQLTSALGFHHRTVTAVLNGRLIPIIDQLIDSVKSVLAKKAIHSPLMIVKGDGTLMSEFLAKERPIETILSGPAASVIGGLALTGEKDGVVLDMGGTTTDIANVSGGHAKIKEEGAKVGGFRTRVRAVEISTFGLGGDSRIWLDKKGNIQIGPERVCPLCVVGEKYPELFYEMKSFKRLGEFKAYSAQEADCFMYLGGPLPETIEPWQKTIIQELQLKPHSLTYLGKVIGEDPETIDLTSLVEAGVLGRISVTPTDILHVQGKYDGWNRDLSDAGVGILARRRVMSSHQFAAEAEAIINRKTAMAVIQSAADLRGEELCFVESPEAMFLMEAAFEEKKKSLLLPRFFLEKPLVAIGAPIEAWIYKAGEFLNAQVIVPENADVANAYGAAVGQITETVELLISADKDQFGRTQYILNMPWNRVVYRTWDEAMFYAIHEGRKYLEHLLRDSGCSSWNIVESSEDIMVATKESEPEVREGTRLKLVGVGSGI